jgi:anti-sigma-K factor RskA
MTTQREEDDDTLRAAEYALGVLSERERRIIESEVAANPALKAEIAQWQERLVGMADTLAPVEPPARVLAALRARIAAEGVPETQPVARASLWDSAAFWRGLAFASLGATAAACIAMVVAFAQLMPVPQPEGRLVATLDQEQGQVAFVVSYDSVRQQIVVVPARVAMDPNRVPELWIVTRAGRVISLGVVNGAEPRAISIPGDLIAETQAGTPLVITLEPPGGAPGGVATGPTIAKGELAPI